MLKSIEESKNEVIKIPLSNGDEGIYQTVQVMIKILNSDRGVLNPKVIEVARSIVRNIPEKNPFAEISAIHEWVKKHVRYTYDPSIFNFDHQIENIELIQDPVVMIDQINSNGMAYGDCDDMALLEATLLSAIGYPTDFIIVGKNDFQHVYLQTHILAGNKQITIRLDPIFKKQLAGWEVPAKLIRRKKIFKANEGGYMLQQLGQLPSNVAEVSVKESTPYMGIQKYDFQNQKWTFSGLGRVEWERIVPEPPKKIPVNVSQHNFSDVFTEVSKSLISKQNIPEHQKEKILNIIKHEADNFAKKIGNKKPTVVEQHNFISELTNQIAKIIPPVERTTQIYVSPFAKYMGLQGLGDVDWGTITTTGLTTIGKIFGINQPSVSSTSAPAPVIIQQTPASGSGESKTITYLLIGVGVLVAGAIIYKMM